MSASVFASSVLTQLPFGIKIGVTKNSEIEDRGTCMKQIEVSPNYFRCEYYSMAGGKFTVYSSQNEVVTKLFFHTLTSNLPTAWQKIGLELNDMDANHPSALKLDKIVSIFKENGAVNLTVSKPNSVTICNFIDFDVDSNHFKVCVAQFEDKYYGMSHITITEGY